MSSKPRQLLVLGSLRIIRIYSPVHLQLLWDQDCLELLRVEGYKEEDWLHAGGMCIELNIWRSSCVSFTSYYITTTTHSTINKIKYKKCCLTLLCLLHILHTLHKSMHTHTVKEPVKQTRYTGVILTSTKYLIVLVVIILANISPSGQRTHFFCFCLCCSHAEGLNPFPSLA